MSSEYQDKRLLGVLEGISESLEDIATSLRLLSSDPRPEPKAEAECPECEPCVDMDHQKNYQ